MKRREFLGVLGGAAASWPVVARAQQPPKPVIGFLSSASAASFEHLLAPLRQSLDQEGYAEGRNLMIEYRWAETQFDRLPGLAADLVRQNVVLIVTGGGSLPALAVKSVAPEMPVVFILGADPVKVGLTASFNRPGGNITGVTMLANDLAAKRLGFLRDLKPTAVSFGLLLNPSNAYAAEDRREAEGVSRATGLRLHIAQARSEREIETAFESFVTERIDVLLVPPDPVFIDRRDRIIALAARHGVPTIYPYREDAVAGGLLSYGASFTTSYRQAGIYVGRILKGTKPADLPVVQPSKFELIINLRTAKTFGLEIPSKLLFTADEVIE
jgi:putative tryptophan/tyrosine transport system substrate-binding protein